MENTFVLPGLASRRDGGNVSTDIKNDNHLLNDVTIGEKNTREDYLH